ncbi:MAG TPA: hypothetical protein VHV31_17280 [Nitrolancea sp.]|nr:hypothetical protein [Nitrolancea sp.]
MSADSAGSIDTSGVAALGRLRSRLFPMLEAVAREYESRTESGYPVLLDNVEFGGYFGIMLDPSYGLYFVTDGQKVFAQINMVGWRNDVRSSANKEKFAGSPFGGIRPVPETLSNQQLRNLLSELLSHWNLQPLIIHHTDS